MNRGIARKKQQLPSSDEEDMDEQVASMQDDEDDEGEDDLEAEGDDDLEADAEGDEDEELDDEEPQDDDEDMDIRKDDDAVSDASNSSLPKQPRLKIKLKLPALPASSASATPVPEEVRKAGGRGKRRRPIPDYAEDDEDDFDDEMMPSSATATSSKGRLTSRQAVLANVVDATHVTLESAGATPKGKKKQLNESEIALKREETARKRRNLTEKKLEDEKLETINRLLKKQTRPRGGKKAQNAPPATTSATPKEKSGSGAEDEDGMDVVEEEELVEKTPPRPPSPPTMYRWISSIRPAVEAAKPEEEVKEGGEGEDKTEVKRESSTEERSGGAIEVGKEESKPAVEEKTMTISFSVPVSLLPRISESEQKPPLSVPRPVAICDYEGCSLGRKYRLVKDWTKGACGMAHLKALESTVMDTGV